MPYRLRALRQERGLSQERLGGLCKPPISFRTIQKIEAGGNPKMSTLMALARALDVSPSELLEAAN